MKKLFSITAIFLLLFSLCACSGGPAAQITATTAPVWQFTSALCKDTPLSVSRLVTESVSCLHDYTLTVDQMKKLENAELVVISGADLEEFMHDILHERRVVDASENVPLLESGTHHTHEQSHDHEHEHEHDPHIWLSPANAMIMAANICNGLCLAYPQYSQQFQANLQILTQKLEELDAYGHQQLNDLPCRDIITFHDGFAYLANSYDLHILRAIEEESGSEASARELIELIGLVREHSLPAVFTEVSGSASAAGIICDETGIKSFPLDMAMAGDDYFDSMYHNIDTLKEALG